MSYVAGVKSAAGNAIPRLKRVCRRERVLLARFHLMRVRAHSMRTLSLARYRRRVLLAAASSSYPKPHATIFLSPGRICIRPYRWIFLDGCIKPQHVGVAITPPEFSPSMQHWDVLCGGAKVSCGECYSPPKTSVPQGASDTRACLRSALCVRIACAPYLLHVIGGEYYSPQHLLPETSCRQRLHLPPGAAQCACPSLNVGDVLCKACCGEYYSPSKTSVPQGASATRALSLDASACA